jgi:hypothetical protein
MIQIVMKPDYDAGIKERESLYKVLFNGEDVGLRVRGLKAAHAEEKLMEIFRLDLKGKEVDYDLEAYRNSKASKGEDEVKPEDEKRKEAKQDREQLLPGME